MNLLKVCFTDFLTDLHMDIPFELNILDSIS